MAKSCFTNNENKINKKQKKVKKIKNTGKKMNRVKKIVGKVFSTSLSTSVNKRRKLPYGLRNNVWTKYNGEVFNAKCYVDFCEQIVNPFTFEVGHDIPVSKGGSDSINNLRPICRNCNNSMSNNYTIAEYSNKFK
jgi:5-methylcytosine-specific restriction endonuclease McrA